MATNAEVAINNSATPAVVAMAAAKDAATSTATQEQKDSLAKELFKELTGRFPQESTDRRAVFIGAFWLAGATLLLSLGYSLTLALNDLPTPDWLPVLATAGLSGVIGGIFGYAKQS